MPSNNRSFSSLGRLNNQPTLDRSGLGGSAGQQRRTFEDLRGDHFGNEEDGFYDGLEERTRTVMIQLPSDNNVNKAGGDTIKEKLG